MKTRWPAIVGRRCRLIVGAFLLAASVSVVLAVEEPNNEQANVWRKIISRKKTPLGGSILRRLVGGRDSIRKSPYPYAERSFSRRSSAVSSSLRERHEQAFGAGADEISSYTNSEDRAQTNRIEQTRAVER
ncbi:MAG: hypothetical protein ACUVWX_08190 [Kiritimatiellia bacterium]